MRSLDEIMERQRFLAQHFSRAYAMRRRNAWECDRTSQPECRTNQRESVCGEHPGRPGRGRGKGGLGAWALGAGIQCGKKRESNWRMINLAIPELVVEREPAGAPGGNEPVHRA